MLTVREPYPSDVSDDEWALVAPYLTLLPESAKQREHSLREVFNGLRFIVKTGAPWRWMPHDLPPWPAVYQQAVRWWRAGCFEMMVHDLRGAAPGCGPDGGTECGRAGQPDPAFHAGARAGWDGYKRTRGSKLHMAVDTMGHLLALHVTPANEGDRTAVAELAEAVQEVTGQSVELAYVDQGYTGEKAEEAAARHGIRLEVVKLADAKRGFVPLPRRPPVAVRPAASQTDRRRRWSWNAPSPGCHAFAGSPATTSGGPKPSPMLRRAAALAPIHNSF